MEENLVNSIKKAFDILDILAFEDISHKGIRLKELSEKTGIRPNTLHGILKTMIYCGYLEQNENSLYLTGKRCRQIGVINRFQITPELSEILQRELYALRARTGESVSFYVLENGERINYTNIQSGDIIKIDYTMLEQKSIYEYPSGKVLIAYCPAAERELVIRKNGFPHELWNGISNMQSLEEECERIKAQGHSERYSETVREMSFAVPVFTNDGKLFGSVGIYTVLSHENRERVDYLIKELKSCATAIASYQI
jgi:Transcriptional regulator